MPRKEKDPIIGQTIITIQPLNKLAMADEGWDGEQPPLALVLSDGTILYASRDPEGNGPGALFGRDSRGITFQLLAR